MKKKVLIAGSTGMIGSLILKYCLESEHIAKVTTINRDQLKIKNPKLTNILHTDFLDFNKIKQYFKHVDIIYYCIGVYTGKVSKEKFHEITVDILESFAKTLKKESPNATFCLMSAGAADRTEKSKVLFVREKGIAENRVFAQFPQAYFFRPHYIYPTIKRKEPHIGYAIMRLLYHPVIKRLSPDWSLTSEQLAKTMFIVGLRGSKQQTFENKEIKEFVKKHTEYSFHA